MGTHPIFESDFDCLTEMSLTREENANLYIKEHRIEALMSQLAESLIYKQPIDPRAYLVDLLQGLINARENNRAPECLLDSSNIESIFGLIDVMGKGSIALRDALSALEKVGIEKDIFGCNPVPKEIFIKNTRGFLEAQQANFIKKNRIIEQNDTSSPIYILFV